MRRKDRNQSDVNSTWREYLRFRRRRDRNALVEHYAHLVDGHAIRLSRRLPCQIAPEEIRCAAFEGLLQAVQGFDPDRNVRFETFCHRRISGAVLDWLRSLDPQSRSVRSFEKRRIRTSERLEALSGRCPTTGEIAARMGLPLKRYKDLSRRARASKQIHFSAMGHRQERSRPGASRDWDIRDARMTDPSGRVARRMLSDHLTKGLTRDERLVLVLYYYEDLTMAEIGAVLRLSESRVSQLHKDILLRLRRRFGSTAPEELAV